MKLNDFVYDGGSKKHQYFHKMDLTLFCTICGRIQEHPLFKFLNSNDIKALCNACPDIQTELDPVLIGYFLLSEKDKKNYTAVCSLGIIPDVNLMDICTLDRGVLEMAIINGHTNVVIWLLDTFGKTNPWIIWHPINLVAEYGQLDIIKALTNNTALECTSLAMNYACMNGHFNVVEWLHENRNEWCTVLAMDWASKNGHLDMVKWLHENRTEGCTTNAMDWASINGHLHP